MQLMRCTDSLQTRFDLYVLFAFKFMQLTPVPHRFLANTLSIECVVTFALFISQDDPDTLLKCLTIASEMLQGVAASGLNPTLTTLVQTLVINSHSVPL